MPASSFHSVELMIKNGVAQERYRDLARNLDDIWLRKRTYKSDAMDYAVSAQEAWTAKKRAEAKQWTALKMAMEKLEKEEEQKYESLRVTYLYLEKRLKEEETKPSLPSVSSLPTLPPTPPLPDGTPDLSPAIPTGIRGTKRKNRFLDSSDDEKALSASELY